MPNVPRSAFLLAAALVLAACATPSQRAAPPGGFDLQGRVSIRHGSDGATGRISWSHSAETDELLIASSLGQGIARIRRVGQDVELFSEGKEYRAADAESLTERVLGWRLPLAGLPDWVQGRADPGSASQATRDASGRIVALVQNGWKIEYQNFEGNRPSRMRLTRPSLEIRLVIDQWTS